MPLELPSDAPTLLIRRSAFERAGLARTDIDARYNLTPEEFRVEGELIVIGPLYEEKALTDLVDQLEGLGLAYFDDYFEMSGNWPVWSRIFATERRE
ncbi:MAG TPA: hypothetical protein VFS44_07675 [Gemmatimonadaceae bacterium]|nr:hypothetical protein [Gemmatimonadaceae bacterium]